MTITESRLKRGRAAGLAAIREAREKNPAPKRERSRRGNCATPRRVLVEAWPKIEEFLVEHPVFSYREIEMVLGKFSREIVNNAVEFGLLRGIASGRFERGEYSFQNWWGSTTNNGDEPFSVAESYKDLPKGVFDAKTAAGAWGVMPSTAHNRLILLAEMGLVIRQESKVKRDMLWRRADGS